MARAMSSRVCTTTSMRSPPTLAFSSSDVPRAMILPRSTTAIVFASASASSRYCVVSSSVTPSSTSLRITSHMPSRPRGSSPVVGSSRKRIRGLPVSALARSSLRRMPPEYVLTTRSAASASSNCSSRSSARRRASALGNWYSRPKSQRFSLPVRFSSTAAYWPESPMRRRICCAWRTTSRPATVACPESGRRSVARIRTVVVFPAPFGPSKPSTVPSATVRSSPSRARTSLFRER